MSYPTIGMLGIIPGDEWTPANIEKMLRNGIRIMLFGEHDGVYCDYNAKTEEFELHIPEFHSVDPTEKSFKTFLELATFVAFYGESFL